MRLIYNMSTHICNVMQTHVIEQNINIKNAVEIMNKNKITALFVVNNGTKVPKGIIHIHFLLQHGL